MLISTRTVWRRLWHDGSTVIPCDLPMRILRERGGNGRMRPYPGTTARRRITEVC